MIVKTASEIIRQAKFLAQCENSDFLDDFTTTNIINEVYEEIYQDIITHTKNYLCTLDFNGEVLLPCNCYQIDSVVNKNTGVTIDRAPKAQSINGCYTIENQYLKVIGAGNEEYTLKYYPEPVTITTGYEPIKFKLIDNPETGSQDDIEKVIAIRDDFFIYKNGSYYRKYTFKTNTIEEVHPTPWDFDPIVWNGKTVVTENEIKGSQISSIKINGEEKIEEFNKIPNPWWKPEFPDDPFYKYKQPMYLMSDGKETLFITYLSLVPDIPGLGGVYETYEIYEDGTKNIIASSLNKDNAYIGYNGNLEGGRGIITYDLNKESYSFEGLVPDTILDFPVNIFYTVMEERIALLLASIVGVENEYLKTDYKDRIEQQYYNALKRDDYSPTRIRNVLPARRF